jgi:5-methylcytosine-specific restriction endonuclease McrA
MHPTKEELIERNGLRCMLCLKEFPYHEIQYHHIVPKYASKHMGLPPDNTYDNGCLLCLKCHAKVHEYSYWSDEYQFLMDVIEDNKK